MLKKSRNNVDAGGPNGSGTTRGREKVHNAELVNGLPTRKCGSYRTHSFIAPVILSIDFSCTRLLVATLTRSSMLALFSADSRLYGAGLSRAFQVLWFGRRPKWQPAQTIQRLQSRYADTV